MRNRCGSVIVMGILMIGLSAHSAASKGDASKNETAAKLAAEQKKAEAEKKAMEAKLAAEQKKAEAEKKAMEAKLAAEQKKAEAEKKAMEAKKLAEEKAELIRKEAEEKEKRKSPYEKAMEEAIAEDKISALQKYDVVMSMGSFSQIVRSDGLKKDKAGKVNVAFKATDIYSSNYSGSYSSAGGSEKAEKLASAFRVYLRSNMSQSGSMIFDNCLDLAENSMASGKGFRIIAKGVPHHTIFMTERELLIRYGYERFISRLKHEKKKYQSVKKFMNSIDDELIPRGSVGLNTDKLEVSCEAVDM